MSVFTYHILELPVLKALGIMLFPLKSGKIRGLIHAETMTAMALGSPVYSLSRFFSRKIIVFAQWEDETVLDHFLMSDHLGKQFNRHWFVRLEFLRQWGTISGFQIPKKQMDEVDNQPVAAVTIARMKYLEIPRFLRWGRPVKKLVRDHPGTTISLASIRYPNVISTFSIWITQKEMKDMVLGHSQIPQPKRHIHAMKERDRKDFHFEFTTLRFKIISENSIKGQSHLPPKTTNELPKF